MRRTVGFLLAGLALSSALCAQPAGDAKSGDAKSLSLRLVYALNLRPTVEESLMQFLPPGEPGQIALRLLGRDKTFWTAYDEDVAALYEKKLTRDELRKIVEFYESDAGRTWTAKQPEILAEQASRMKQGQGPLMTVMEVGCTTALLAPALAKAKEKAGAAATVNLDDFLTKADPFLQSAKQFCGCILREAAKKIGPEYLSPARQDDLQKLSGELIQNGTCPLPAETGS